MCIVQIQEQHHKTTHFFFNKLENLVLACSSKMVIHFCYSFRFIGKQRNDKAVFRGIDTESENRSMQIINVTPNFWQYVRITNSDH